jgi:nitrite reductase/ring-hydroxylating ferredoxin subunit
MNDWIRVAKLDDIPALGARTIEISDMTVAVFRNSIDQVFKRKR